ncbi:MAG: DNA-methyltransferase [Candidatus Heimdallarchaeota archaeon]
METTHKVFLKDSSDMSEIDSGSVDLVITSPPYPMIEMWDSHFCSMNIEIKEAFEDELGMKAFNLMHQELERVWGEVARVLKKGGLACVNIGDATRKIGKNFQLFPNHVKVIKKFLENDFIELPCILWRKPTNSPNKFLGSGMLPPNAYVTLEHEYILIFRKGKIQQAILSNSDIRHRSAFFWEERNNWFTDLWKDIRGSSQDLHGLDNNYKQLRKRSAAFPLEIPYRLINMFSIYGNLVLDPFWGTGTTSLASMITSRNSIGYECNPQFLEIFKKSIRQLKKLNFEMNRNRLKQHTEYIKNYRKKAKYNSIYYKFPVFTKQEINILLYSIKNFSESEGEFIINYEKFEFDNLPEF